MRRALFLLTLVALVALPVAAQNTDIESLSGLQFNFGNPGARSLGMGGAFLGLADDASAAEANPAGLTILRKAEISIEGRNYVEQQMFTTSGIYPEIERTPFTHYSDRVQVSFASFVYPIKQFTVGAYFHEPLRNSGGGVVFPERNQFSGAIEKYTPHYWWPTAGGEPISEAQCNTLRAQTGRPDACFEYRVDPFVSALDVRQRTWGLAGAWQLHPKFSVGLTARMQTFQEGAFTFRYDPDFFSPKNVSVQATARANGDQVELTEERDLTFGAGFKWSPTDKISVGGVYKQGASYDAPTFYAGEQTNFDFILYANTKFHMPDVAGLGVSIRPIPVLTINVDAVHVKYSNLVDDFVSAIADVSALDSPFEAKDVTEIHVGAEYFFATKIPFAIRGGYWLDPAHAVTWKGPTNRPDYIAEAMLYPGSDDQEHFSIGGGFAWPKFQIDFAYDTSDTYKVGSISVVRRF